jgi:hypothetical protein
MVTSLSTRLCIFFPMNQLAPFYCDSALHSHAHSPSQLFVKRGSCTIALKYTLTYHYIITRKLHNLFQTSLVFLDSIFIFQRLPGGKILYEDQVYADIDEFLKMNKSWCQIPFENDNAVTYTQVFFSLPVSFHHSFVVKHQIVSELLIV